MSNNGGDYINTCDKCNRKLTEKYRFKVVRETSEYYNKELCFKCAIKEKYKMNGLLKAIKFTFNAWRKANKSILDKLYDIWLNIVGIGYILICLSHFIMNKDLLGLSLLILFLIQIWR